MKKIDSFASEKEHCSLFGMRILKDDHYKSILFAARKEFISNGFKDTSMRNIAKEANVAHDLDRHKIRGVKEYFRFEYAGWRELTGV